jgi:hypothetical protein
MKKGLVLHILDVLDDSDRQDITKSRVKNQKAKVRDSSLPSE